MKRVVEYKQFMDTLNATRQHNSLLRRVGTSNRVFLANINPVTPFQMQENSLEKITPWIAESLDAIDALTIQKCFFKTIKIDLFRPVSLDAEMNALNDLMASVRIDLNTLSGTEVTETN